jgi:alkanesulfonate monooxygenase SsuD/methylene tetrahydromethanopterin reductase-like flavin-dependent oxidoreductase (luciferase family)
VCEPALRRGRAAAARAEADVDRGIVVFCAIDDDPSVAVRLMRPCLAFHLPHFGDVAEHAGFGAELATIREAAARGDAAAMAAAVSDDMVEAMAVTGTPEQVRHKLSRYEGLVDWPVLMPPIGLAADVSRKQVTRILTTFGQGP